MPFDPLSSTAKQLQLLMTEGRISSEEIVRACLLQIQRYDGFLKAMLATAPGSIKAAQKLDAERLRGRIRGPLHGTPILVKDNIETGPALGMNTTAGSFALVGSTAHQAAPVIEALVKAGAIVIGKAQLSEFAFYKGTGLPPGWSAIGGQCQSAYTTDEVQPDDGMLGYSSPGGSSTGSAVGVSAGYAPVSLGTDTTGSVIIPATRAALFGIRMTPESISMDGIIPFSKTFDALGVMAKTVVDLAQTIQVIRDEASTRKSKHRIMIPSSTTWRDLKVGVVAPEEWKWSPDLAKPNPQVEHEMVHQNHAAYTKIRALAKTFKEVEVISPDAVQRSDRLYLWDLFRADFESDLNSYLQTLRSSKVHSLADIIAWNKKHSSKELPTGYSQQDLLEGAHDFDLGHSERNALLTEIQYICREEGIEKTFKNYDVDVIMGPADSAFSLLVCAGGYPSATMPLSYLTFNNRPFGMFAIARRDREDTLIEVMSAWEATFPARRAPANLTKKAQQKFS